MRRVAVIGCPGAGKSTFALRLAQIVGLEVVHLDRLYWHAGWVPTPREEWLRIQQAALAGERWIADGNYAASLDLRLAVADTVIFLDLPRGVCLWRAVRRVLRARWTTRPDMANGCRERLDLTFLAFIWGFRRAKRPAMLRQLREVPAGTRVVHLTSSRAAARFLAELERGPAPGS